MRAPARSAGSAAGVVRWGTHLAAFELAATEARVLDRAAVVFGPWRNGSCGSLPTRVRFFVRESRRQQDRSGTWRVEWGEGQVAVAPTLDRAITAVEYRSIVELLDPATKVVALHAALLSKGGRGVVVVGPKEAGKSTLACGLWRAGWRLHSDDAAVFENGHRARGVPRRVSLRHSARELLGDDLWERIEAQPATSRTPTGLLFHPHEGSTRDSPCEVDVAAVVFLARRGAAAGPAQAVRLDAATALLGMAPYCYRAELEVGVPLRTLGPLADHAVALDLGRGDVARMVERVEEALEP